MERGGISIIVSSIVSVANVGESGTEWPGVSADYSDPRWYAVCTSANHEKSAARQLVLRSVEHFLPLYDSVRRWKDRRMKLQLPLFPGYLFVRIALKNRLQVLQIPGVARLVGFSGIAAPLPEEQIDALRAGLGGGMRAEPHPYLNAGQRVRVKDGALAGAEGVLLRWKGGWRVVVSLDLIQRSIAVEIDACNVAPAK